MDPVFEIVKDIGLLMLGAIITFGAQWINDRRRVNRQKREAYDAVSRMIANVTWCVGHGHDFEHKNDWGKELGELAKKYRDWIGDLYEPIKIVSWRIRDNDFAHDSETALRYCCDELLADLHLLALAILPEVSRAAKLSREEEEQKAKEHIGQILINTRYTGGFFAGSDLEGQFANERDEFYGQWKARTLDMICDWKRVNRIIRVCGVATPHKQPQSSQF